MDSDDSPLTFDVLEIDAFLSKNNNTPYTKDKNQFTLLPNTDLKNQNQNSNFPKYFSHLEFPSFTYIGKLSNQLKREQGYTKFENNDEFLGEEKNEKRDGFGIYKYNGTPDEYEIYIGEFSENTKNGVGLYLNIIKCVEVNKNKKLINYDCGIGDFANDQFVDGKIFSVKDGVETLYQGKLNELGVPKDDSGLVVEGGNKIFTGKIDNGELIEGRNIFIDENGEKLKAYYFTKTDDKDKPYNFDISKNEDNDESAIEMIQNSSVKKYQEQIQNIFDKVNESFEKYKNFDEAFKVDFDANIKNVIQELIKNLKDD